MYRAFSAITAFVFLTSCGGGGSSTPPPTSGNPPPPPPSSNNAPSAAVSNYETTFLLGQSFAPSATDSSDPDGDSLSYTWEITSAPAGSSIDTTYSDVTPVIEFDVNGTYNINLTVSDGSLSDTVTLDPITVFKFGMTELTTFGADFAEFDIVSSGIVVGTQNILTHIAADKSETVFTIAPLRDPTAQIQPNIQNIAISHGGDYAAAVFHDVEDDIKAIRIWNLGDGTEVRTIELGDFTYDIGDIFIDASGLVYTVKSVQNPFKQFLMMIDITTGQITDFDNLELHTNGPIRMNAHGTHLYALVTGDTPQYFESVELRGGLPIYGTRQDISDPLAHCHDFWVGADYESIITACGAIYNASANPDDDMTYKMNLNNQTLSTQFYGAASGFTQMISMLDPSETFPDGHDLYIYDQRNGGEIGRFTLDNSEDPNGSVWTARHHFAAANSGEIFVVAKDNPSFSTRTAILTILPGAYAPN